MSRHAILGHGDTNPELPSTRVLIERYDKGRRCTAHHAPSSLLARFTRLVILWNLPLRIQQNIDEALDTSKCLTSLMPSTYNSPPRIFASLYHTLDVGFQHARCWEDELKKKGNVEATFRDGESTAGLPPATGTYILRWR
jgi:hypothetical protein